MNESRILAEKYVGMTWDEIIKDFPHHHQGSHTIKYNNQSYFVICNRFDRCIDFALIKE